jgi:hypothetical protein
VRKDFVAAEVRQDTAERTTNDENKFDRFCDEGKGAHPENLAEPR